MELLLAMQEKMDANLKEIKENIKPNQAEMKAMQAETDATLKEINAGQDAWMEEMKADREAMEAYPENMEGSPEDTESIAVHEDIPKEEAAVQPVRALKKRHGDRRLVLRHRGKLKEQTEGNGGVPEEVGCRLQRYDPPC
jgi:hypothetical protein